MTWHFAIAIHLALSTAYALLLRKVARDLKDFSRVTMLIMYAVVVLPVGILVAIFMGGLDFSFQPSTWVLLVLGGVLFSLTNIVSYKANSHIDAAQFSIITNLESIFTIIFAFVLIDEHLNSIQLIGAFILVISAIFISVERVNKRTFIITPATWLAILSSLILSIAFINEKTLLGHINYQTYLVIGWGFQTLSILIIAIPDINKIKNIKKTEFKDMLGLGVLRAISGLSFIFALTKADAALLSSIRSFKPVLVFVAAYFVLGESKNFWRKSLASVLAVIGLLLLI